MVKVGQRYLYNNTNFTVTCVDEWRVWGYWGDLSVKSSLPIKTVETALEHGIFKLDKIYEFNLLLDSYYGSDLGDKPDDSVRSV